MKASPSDQIPATKEEGIAALQALAEELGHAPKKSELPEALRNRVRVLFGKWCYAQAEAGFVIPSEKVQEKRRKREEHKRQVAERQAKRDAEKREAKRKKRQAAAAARAKESSGAAAPEVPEKAAAPEKTE